MDGWRSRGVKEWESKRVREYNHSYYIVGVVVVGEGLRWG
jgi:hypothetical protein